MAKKIDLQPELDAFKVLTGNPDLFVQYVGASPVYLFEPRASKSSGELIPFKVMVLGANPKQAQKKLLDLIEAHIIISEVTRQKRPV
jgi:hypothetical protein